MLNYAEVAVAVKKTPKEALRTAVSFLSSPLPFGVDVNQIVVKPSIFNPNLVGNTSFKMARAIVDLFKDVGRVYLVESDNPFRDADEAFKECGYEALQSEDVELVNLSTGPMQSVRLPGNHFEKRMMPEILHRIGVFVNLATLKPEPSISAIGAGIKNLFGLLPERNKNVYHNHIDSVLLDLLSSYTPDLTVIDLTHPVVGRREDGITKDVGGVILGVDPVAVDAFCAHLLGMDPLEVPHIRMAHESGLGEALIDRIRVRGTDHQKNLLFEALR